MALETLSRVSNMGSFIMLNRSEETIELIKHPNAFTLLTAIAIRARRTDTFNVHNLKVGEALIGDYNSYGLTRQQYRTSLRSLISWGFLTTKPTNKGTIATIASTKVYDINQQPVNQPAPIQQPATNQRLTTNNNDNNVNNEKKKEKDVVFVAQFDEVRRFYPGTTRGNPTEFANFKKKHSDWKNIIPLLLPAIQKQKQWRKDAGEDFRPSWKIFATWINNSCWEDSVDIAEATADNKACIICKAPYVEGGHKFTENKQTFQKEYRCSECRGVH